jgi:antitoxin VapB
MSHLRAKVFSNGGSQAIRLPKKFRVDASEVEIWRDGDELRLRPVTERHGNEWAEMFARIDKLGFDMTLEDREQPPLPESRVYFDDDK